MLSINVWAQTQGINFKTIPLLDRTKYYKAYLEYVKQLMSAADNNRRTVYENN